MTQFDPYEDDLAADDWNDEFWGLAKEEPDCPACCDAGCRQCRPTRWDLWRWSWRDRWWRLRTWRQRRRAARDDPYPF